MSGIANLLKLIDGYKTYIVAVLIGVQGAATYLGYPTPDFVWQIEAAAGLGAVRSALAKTP